MTLKSNNQSLTDRNMNALRFDKYINQKIPISINEYMLFTILIKPKSIYPVYIYYTGNCRFTNIPITAHCRTILLLLTSSSIFRKKRKTSFTDFINEKLTVSIHLLFICKTKGLHCDVLLDKSISLNQGYLQQPHAIIQCCEIVARIVIRAYCLAENVCSWELLISLSSGESRGVLSLFIHVRTRNFNLVIWITVCN